MKQFAPLDWEYFSDSGNDMGAENNEVELEAKMVMVRRRAESDVGLISGSVRV